MNLKTAELTAIELLDKHDLLDEGWYFAWNTRKFSAGVCSYRKKSIELSKPLTALADDAEVIDTILHEIAHALTPGHGHDRVWQRKAREIGCNGKRCYDLNEKPSTTIAYHKIAKYKAVCPNGHVHVKNRMPKIGRKYSCPTCCPRYNEKYLLIFHPNT